MTTIDGELNVNTNRSILRASARSASPNRASARLPTREQVQADIDTTLAAAATTPGDPKTNRAKFINWLIAELANEGLQLPPYWTYGHLTDAVQRWRNKLQERPTDPSAGR